MTKTHPHASGAHGSPLASRLVLVVAGLLWATMLNMSTAQATTLQEALAAARRQDPTVQAALLQVDISRQQRQASRAALQPSLGAQASTTTGRLHTDAAGTRHYDNRLAGINLTIPLYRPQDTARVEQAQTGEQLAQSQLAQALQTLAEQVAASYFAVLSAQDALDVAQAQRAAIHEQFIAAQESFAAGSATITDQQEAQARLDLNSAQQAEARNQLQAREAAFTQLTGLPASGLQRLALDARLPQMPTHPQSYWEGEARTQSFLVRQAEIGVQAARHGLTAAHAAHYPTVSIVSQLGGVHGQTNLTAGTPVNRSHDASATLQVQVPLYAGGGLMAQERASMAALSQRESQLEAARRGATQQARELFLALQSSLQQAEALQAAVRSSQLALQSNHVGYRAGVRITIDVLNAQQQLFQARQNLAATRYAVLLNQLRLKAAVGSLNDADIAAVDTYLQAPAKPAPNATTPRLQPAAAH